MHDAAVFRYQPTPGACQVSRLAWQNELKFEIMMMIDDDDDDDDDSISSVLLMIRFLQYCRKAATCILKQNTGHTHNTHNTETTTPPNTRTKHTTKPLSSDRRLRDDGACHLPRQGG